MESLKENRPLLWSIVASISAVTLLVLGASPDLCAQFSIVEFPADVSCVLREFRVLMLVPAVPADTIRSPGGGPDVGIRRGSDSLFSFRLRETAYALDSIIFPILVILVE